MGEYEQERDERLKPCPFCGSETAPFVGQHFNEVRRQYDFQWQVVCNFNNGGCGGSGGVRPDEGAAIAAWNRRADA